ncbi:MAG: hypothetical protein ABI346_04365 [Candidatus Baltobacteraceae bacterium]
MESISVRSDEGRDADRRLAVWGAVIVGFVSFVAILLSSEFRTTPYNNQVLLADAWRHGRSWIDFPGDYIDALLYAGKRYVIEGPMPAVLLLPFVLFFGKATNQTLLATALGAVATGAAWELCRRIGSGVRARVWLVLFLFAGTDLWWTAALGDVWFVAHTSAVAFTLLALVELLGRRRAPLVFLWGICAAESRFPLVLALPVYAYFLTLEGIRGQRFLPRSIREALRRLAPTLLVVVPALALWIWYNEVRWGVATDIGFAAWYARPEVGGMSGGGSQFALRFLPSEAWSFFVQPPSFKPAFPWIVPDIGGQALIWTSPALVLAFLARRPLPLVCGLWAATALVAGPSLLYYSNGVAQFGMRHALDFEPFAFALMALGTRRGLPRWGAILCAYSALAGAYGLWYWQTFIRR